MPEENQSATAPPENGGAAPTELQVINGGIEIDAVKIDGTSELVKVRQLPISLVSEWGRCQGDEAHLVELLCDRVDRTTVYHLANARMAEMRVHNILEQAAFAQIEEIEKRLIAIREEIAKHEAKPRWSDTLTHETAARIRELGEQLNKKKFADQQERTKKAAETIVAMMTPLASAMSSAPLPTSAGSTSAT